MSFVNKLVAKYFGKKVGQDEFKNDYYLGCAKNYLGQNKRFVIYKGNDISTKVPPMWHAWLHYLTDEVPINDKKHLVWQKEYQPNLTGTKYAYNPSNFSNNAPFYTKWDPNKQKQ